LASKTSPPVPGAARRGEGVFFQAPSRVHNRRGCFRRVNVTSLRALFCYRPAIKRRRELSCAALPPAARHSLAASSWRIPSPGGPDRASGRLLPGRRALVKCGSHGFRVRVGAVHESGRSLWCPTCPRPSSAWARCQRKMTVALRGGPYAEPRCRQALFCHGPGTSEAHHIVGVAHIDQRVRRRHGHHSDDRQPHGASPAGLREGTHVIQVFRDYQPKRRRFRPFLAVRGPIPAS
jgi:hypothetical protein